MRKGPFSNPTILKALKLLRRTYTVAKARYRLVRDFYRSSKKRYYQMMGKEEPSPKALKALKGATQRAYRRVISLYRVVFIEAPKYASKNRDSILKYFVVYLLIWSQEWVWGIPLEAVVILPYLFLVCLDFFLVFLRPSKGSLYLLLLRRRELSKKKRSNFQKLCSAVLLSFIVGARRFLSNPLFGLSKAKTLRLAAFLWYLAFIWNLFEAVLYIAMSGGKLPQSYAPGRDAMLAFMQNFLYTIYLNQTHSFVIDWIISLVIFLVLVSNVWLLRNFDLTPSILGSLGTLGAHFVAIPILQFSKLLVMDLAIVILGGGLFPVNSETAMSSFLALQLVWAGLYYRISNHLYTKGTSTSIDVLHQITGSDRRPRINSSLVWMVTFLRRANIAIGLSNLILFYILGKGLCFLFFGG